MGSLLSVSFSNIYVVKLENDILWPLKPKFYRGHVNDMFNRRKVSTNYILFERSNNYHPKIKLNIELNRNKFLGTSLTCVNSIYNTMVSRTSTKLPMAWSFIVP